LIPARRWTTVDTSNTPPLECLANGALDPLCSSQEVLVAPTLVLAGGGKLSDIRVPMPVVGTQRRSTVAPIRVRASRVGIETHDERNSPDGCGEPP
jgi:hypothetical protein